jgi:ubiquinone/menaquinone biosynthesis C-methylase UbiE
MPKIGEIEYLKRLGAAGIRHAVNKPFSDRYCGFNLTQMGAIFSLLPPPPVRLLDLGCGTGWTSVFFARAGYEVVGVDIASDMIYYAEENRRKAGLENLHFVVCDYEELSFREEFDCAVFYDSLHHAVDERLAIQKAFQALRPTGLCLTSEPGKGHQDSEGAREAMARFQVTEKDMPPAKIVALAREVGFTSFQLYPYAPEITARIFSHQDPQTSYRKRSFFKRLLCGAVASVLGIRSNVFPARGAELAYYCGLARAFRRVDESGGLVLLRK